MGDNLIELQNITKSFYGYKVLDKIDFSIKPGEIHCLVGENGCGKSTMIKIISGSYDYDGGDLIVDGKNYKSLSPIESMHQGIQVIYQDFSLFPNMTVGENILMSYLVDNKVKILNRKKINKIARTILQRINFDLDVNEYISSLNVAKKQMVAICRAILQDAKLIIMDEATSALAHNEVENLFGVVKELKKKGIAVLFVSHKLDEVLQIADRITVMRNGNNVFTGAISDISQDDLIYHMTGKKIDLNMHTDYKIDLNKPIIRVKNYTLKNAFKSVDFTLCTGEVLGITGLLGCGRNELAKSLFGLLPAESGHVFIKDEDCGIISNVAKALKYEIGYVPEDRLTEGLHLNQNIGDNSILCVISRLINRFGFLDARKILAQKKDGLANFNIPNLRYETPAKSLSGGNQQKVVIAKWLAANPKILILNCPTVGVDVGAKSEIHAEIRKLAAKGIGVIVISDDILEIMQVCSRVLLMNEGVIISDKKIADTTMEELEASLVSASKLQTEVTT